MMTIAEWFSGLASLARRSTLIGAILLCLDSAVVAASAGERSAQIAGLTVAIWAPDRALGEPLPTVIFSHGFHGCATQSRFLMRAFAEAGYLVFAPNHRDATCNGGTARRLDPPQAPLAHPEAWDPNSFRDRGEDITHLLAALRSDPEFSRITDWQRLALVGHSLGGYTVLGLAGAWPSWRMSGISAVLALSPYAQPFVVRRDLSGIAAPVMYQGGTRDFGITPAIDKSGGAYALSPAPKYLVEFDGAGHLAWTDIGLMARRPIVDYSLAFLDRYVKGGAAAPILTQAAPEVAKLVYDTGSR